MTNLGNQTIKFDYKYPAKGDNFNRVFRKVLKAGVYAGGACAITAGSDTVTVTVEVDALTMGIESGSDKIVFVDTSVTFEVEEVPAGVLTHVDLPVLYAIFTWADSVDTWAEFYWAADVTTAHAAGGIVICTLEVGGGVITGLNYDDRDYGLFVLDDPDGRDDYALIHDKIYTDVLVEKTANAGVTIEGVLLKDGYVQSSGYGCVPVSTVVAMLPVTFTAAANGGTRADLTIAIPEGWVECDGSLISDSDSDWDGLYVPDLTDDIFLMGDSGNYGVEGGDNDATHNHAAGTLEIPDHTHNYGTLHACLNYNSNAIWFKQVGDNFTSTGHFWGADNVLEGSAGGTSSEGDSVGVEGSTGDTLSEDDVSGSTANNTTATDNRPSYLACKYIIRIK